MSFKTMDDGQVLLYAVSLNNCLMFRYPPGFIKLLILNFDYALQIIHNQL